jgi:adenylylsulfate kinase
MDALRARTLWFFGLSGAGKSTLADAVHLRLVDHFGFAIRLDGDQVRRGLCADLGFSPEDRRENLRRAAEVARIGNDAGLVVAASFITPTVADRDLVAQLVGSHRLIAVYVDTPMDVCEARDPKGLYKRARAGAIPSFTGISSVFELPPASTVRVSTVGLTPDAAVDQLLQRL